jgi:hypothetical protein
MTSYRLAVSFAKATRADATGWIWKAEDETEAVGLFSWSPTLHGDRIPPEWLLKSVFTAGTS